MSFFKKKQDPSFISDEGYVSQTDMVATVFISLSTVAIIILVILGVLAFFTQ